MQRISTFKLLFKCCYKLQDTQKGYMCNGIYIENLSYWAWAKLNLWIDTKDTVHKNDLIVLFSDIKRKQKNNWKTFIKQPDVEVHPFKRSYRLLLSDIEPHCDHIGYHVGTMTVYELYLKKRL